MRLLQTSDWHLGKIFHERNLIEDQKFFLEQIINQIKKAQKEHNPYTALLVPGDIYDRAVPSQDATELLSWFIAKMNEEHPEVHMFFISGNHDSASRLSYGAQIFHKQNIHFCTNTKNLTTPVILCDGQEKVAVYQIPFLTPLSVKTSDDKLLRQQQEMYEAACSAIVDEHKKNYAEIPAVVCAHLFSIGSKVEASERSYVGTAEQVDVSLFDEFSYCAFGHIHGFQFCNKKKTAAYSGSPLPYNFDDSSETFMLDVEIKSKEESPVINKIQFNSLHPIAKIKGTLKELISISAKEKKNFANCFVEATLTDEVMQTGSFSLLQKIYPGILQIKYEAKKSSKSTSSIQERKTAIESREPEKIFNQFLADIYDESELKKDIVVAERKLFVKEAKEKNWSL